MARRASFGRWIVAVVLAATAWGTAGAEDYLSRPDVRRFALDFAERNAWPSADLFAILAKARRQASVLRAMQTPAEAPRRSWQAYRSIFLTPQRIEAGLRFREANAATLARASNTYGIPQEIILAIIGVETVYGRNTGAYRVLDALATLAFDFPERGDYFRYELEQYLLHVREEGLDPLSVRGSYAGAIGIPQFMPGSYRRFAVDFDGDGHRDLRGSPTDAIGSVANFLREHGWRPGEPIAARAQPVGDAFTSLVDGGVKPALRTGDLPALGLVPVDPAPPDLQCAIIELATPGQPSEYHLGFENFFVLTRYNRSSFYATAVLELAQAITDEARRREQVPATSSGTSNTP